tara:strand:- start:115 stop:759 length:645 start_codon:yes stop_codon:yes gene_type:complete
MNQINDNKQNIDAEEVEASKEEAPAEGVASEQKEIDNKLKWYSLKVISGKELAAKENILFELDIEGASAFVDEILVPSEKVVEIRNNKKKMKEKMFFPGYILVNMDMNKQARYIIENTQGVIKFIGPKDGDPVPLRANEIKRIMGEVERKEGVEVITAPFIKGDNVKVVSGPFIDFSGSVEEINDDKQKVKVIVSIFGRPTSIELDFFQVELEK